MTIGGDAIAMRDPQFWRAIAPHLHVDGKMTGERHAFSPALVEQCIADVQRDGYLHLDGILAGPRIDALREGAMLLRARRLPAAFLWVYDESWQLFSSLDGLFSALLGAEWGYIPAFWAWYVSKGDEHAGWHPHKDRAKQVTVFPDGRPKSLSMWIPLTRATPLNGCMHVVPAPFAPAPKAKVDLQNIRALPASPGSVLSWRQDIWHWSGRSSAKAADPRMSLSIELQRGDVPAFQYATLDPRLSIDHLHRLALIGMMTKRFAHMSKPGKSLLTLAGHLQQSAPDLAHLR